MADNTTVSFPFQHLREKVDLRTKKGVKFAVLSCAHMIKQKQHLAGQDPKHRAHGLGESKGTTDQELGNKKLANDAADVKCIQRLVRLGKNGPCDPTWLQQKISKYDFTEWSGPTEDPVDAGEKHTTKQLTSDTKRENLHACKPGNCQTPEDIVTTFEREWAILSCVYESDCV